MPVGQGGSPDMMIGEIRGQVGELIRSINTLSGKFDKLTEDVIRSNVLAEEVGQLKVAVAMLVAKQNERVGAHNLAGVFLRSPMLGWLAALLTLIYGFLSGQLHVGAGE